jgi:hypothetical protein
MRCLRGPLLISAAFSIAAGLPETRLPVEKFALKGFTGDGRWVLFTGVLREVEPGSDTPASEIEDLQLMLAVAPDGAGPRWFRIAAYRTNAPYKVSDRTLWDAAMTAEQREAFLKEHKDQAPAEPTELYPGNQSAVGHGWEARVDDLRRGSCDARLFAVRGAVRTLLMEDPCAGASALPSIYSRATLAWSPEGSRLALQWLVERTRPNVHGDESAVRSLHLAFAPASSLVSIDLLDGGAGDGLERIARRLEKAGFSIAHRGKAQKERSTTAVYFAPGFETEAKKVAELAGAAAEAVQPATWKSPFAVTVAAAR